MGGGAPKPFGCTLRRELVNFFLYLLRWGGHRHFVDTFPTGDMDLFAPYVLNNVNLRLWRLTLIQIGLHFPWGWGGGGRQSIIYV